MFEQSFALNMSGELVNDKHILGLRNLSRVGAARIMSRNAGEITTMYGPTWLARKVLGFNLSCNPAVP